jgi:hypothetical protein
MLHVCDANQALAEPASSSPRFLYDANLARNPIVQKYKTAAEMTDGARGMPIVPSSVVDGILAASRARCPTMPAAQYMNAKPDDIDSDMSDATSNDAITDEEVCRWPLQLLYGHELTIFFHRTSALTTSPHRVQAPHAPFGQ